ncbi:cytochrome P450, family 78, subfamily A, polypeptide 5 [Actinidia rufa]|uniref:Cytochrome P450, family 78, subfamily A, polypeptide 5 n=1 Tax=Actinidia rufa TaxID=165716 RepID=A0A7J0ENR9_9ERIC|nr:cytochrome P450, family 78, subfamily A, polypeptide 5 [Actinidia rufa]
MPSLSPSPPHHLLSLPIHPKLLAGTVPQMGSLAHRKLASMADLSGATRLMAFSLGAGWGGDPIFFGIIAIPSHAFSLAAVTAPGIRRILQNLRGPWSPLAPSLSTTPVIISSHPDTAKEILCGPSFTDRPVKESARSLMFERAIGFASSGDYWRSLRRIAANHMFSPRRISSLKGLRGHVADEMAVGVGMEMRERGVVEVREILHKGSLRNMVESVFGIGLGSQGEELGFMVKEGYDLISKFNLADYFGIGLLDFYGVKRRCHKLALKVNGLVGQIIEERKREGGFCERNDFLSSLLSLPEEDQLSGTDMVAVLWEMIFRGTDTVAILLEWIIARMVLHQDIQAKAKQEIDTCVGNNRHVRDSDIPNLPYLQAIVKEALRMHPPGPLLSWARLAVHDCHVSKFFIPSGTTAMVNMWAITHNPSFWKDPWAFKPERFIEEEFSVLGSDMRLAPFGSGRRVCPGRAMGLATVHLWLARLLHQFKWVLAKPVDLSECLRLSLEMKPLVCRAISRYCSL